MRWPLHVARSSVAGCATGCTIDGLVLLRSVTLRVAHLCARGRLCRNAVDHDQHIPAGTSAAQRWTTHTTRCSTRKHTLQCITSWCDARHATRSCCAAQHAVLIRHSRCHKPARSDRPSDTNVRNVIGRVWIAQWAQPTLPKSLNRPNGERSQ